jgi:hypothetical protein
MTKFLALAFLAMTFTFGAACGGGDDDSTSPTTQGVETTLVPSTTAPLIPDAATSAADQAATWPEAWCSVEPGVSRDDLIAAMGEPTTETTQDLAWVGFGQAYYAFFDATGLIFQMDVNNTAPTEVACEQSRRV